MIEWVYESAIDLSVLIAIILLIRNPLRRLLGAHVSYWLWSLLLLRLLFSTEFTRPELLIQHIPVPDTGQFATVLRPHPGQRWIDQCVVLDLAQRRAVVVWVQDHADMAMQRPFATTQQSHA